MHHLACCANVNKVTLFFSCIHHASHASCGIAWYLMTITAIDGTQLSLASFYALSCAFNSNALHFFILFFPLAKDVL